MYLNSNNDLEPVGCYSTLVPRDSASTWPHMPTNKSHKDMLKISQLFTLYVWTVLHIHNCQYGTLQNTLESLGREPVSLMFSYVWASWTSDRCFVLVNCCHPHSLTLQWLWCSEMVLKEIGPDPDGQRITWLSYNDGSTCIINIANVVIMTILEALLDTQVWRWQLLDSGLYTCDWEDKNNILY